MAEIRRAQQRSVRGSSGGAGRRPPPRKPTHWSVWVGLVVSPVILLVLIIYTFASKESETDEPVKQVEKVDNNAKVNTLIKRIGALKASYGQVEKLIQKEDPSAKKRAEALKDEIKKWRDDWDAIFNPLRDKDDKLPAEYRGHQVHKSTVTQLLSDLNRITGF